MGHQKYARENRQAALDTLESNHAVYILRCESLNPQYISEISKDRIDKYPDWAAEAAQYDTLYYIGSTKNPLNRIGAHLNGRGADFTRLFEPLALMEIRLCSTKEVARGAESNIPNQYRTWQERYCYSDLSQFGTELADS